VVDSALAYYLVMRRNAYCMTVIPKRAFIDPNTEQAFRDLCASHLPTKYRTGPSQWIPPTTLGQ
jgi:hypothetical protein